MLDAVPERISMYLKMEPLFCLCVCAVHLERGIRTVGAKNVKKTYKKRNGESSTAPFGTNPIGNPLKSDRTHDDVG